MLKVFPALLVAAGLAGAIAPSVLAHSHGVRLEETTLAQATTSDTATNLDSQPVTPDDLDIDDLTDDQVDQMVVIFDTYEPQIEAATADYLAAVEVMNNLLVPATADLALADAHGDVVATEMVLNDLIFQRNLALRGVLTVDQRQVINDYVRAYLGIALPESSGDVSDDAGGDGG